MYIYIYMFGGCPCCKMSPPCGTNRSEAGILLCWLGGRGRGSCRRSAPWSRPRPCHLLWPIVFLCMLPVKISRRMSFWGAPSQFHPCEIRSWPGEGPKNESYLGRETGRMPTLPALGRMPERGLGGGGENACQHERCLVSAQ